MQKIKKHSCNKIKVNGHNKDHNQYKKWLSRAPAVKVKLGWFVLELRVPISIEYTN
jgi:hypothetical protein